MEYIKSISLKGIGIGLLIGYIIPMTLIKLLMYMLFQLGITSVFGSLSMVVLLVPLLLSPIVASYLAAKHSSNSPVFNGVLTTVLGILFIVTFVQLNGLIVYIIFVTVSVSLGFVGSKRYVTHG